MVPSDNVDPNNHVGSHVLRSTRNRKGLGEPKIDRVRTKARNDGRQHIGRTSSSAECAGARVSIS